MSGSNSAERKRYEPLVLVETADLSEEDWLDYRRRGIGGSDVSAIFGTSPFRTARDLYYDKLNIASVEDDEGNWVAMEMGHLLEPLVAKIFERKTGYRVYQIKKMFQHPQYPWMLADVDYFVELPDGTTAMHNIHLLLGYSAGQLVEQKVHFQLLHDWVMGRNGIFQRRTIGI